MFAAATSFFARTNISQNYNYGSSGGGISSRTSTPGPSGSSTNASSPGIHAPPTQIGLWKVTPATHKVTAKRVSVWSFDKRSPELERLDAHAKEKVMEVLKSEVSVVEIALEEYINIQIFVGECPGSTASSIYPR